MDITVVIPVNGRCTYLDKSIRTILRQRSVRSGLAAEIIVVDNARHAAEQAATRDVCVQAASHFPSQRLVFRYIATRHINPKHRNAGYPRNVGIRFAAAEIVLMADADILHVSETLAQHLAHHRQHANLLLFSYLRDCDPQVPLTDECLTHALHDQRYPLRMASHTDWYGCMCVSARRSHLVACSGFEEAFMRWGYEDYDLARRLQLRGTRVVRDDDILTLHQSHPSNTRGASIMKSYAGLRQLLRITSANRGRMWGRALTEPEVLPTCSSVCADQADRPRDRELCDKH